MKRLALLFLTLFLSIPAEARVTVKGHTYSTGLISNEPAANAEYQAGFRAINRPAAWDSRDHGWVPKVRDQGACGSCWDHAITGAFETAAIIAGKANASVDLAEQDPLVNNKQDYGCNGGFMDATWWVQKGQAAEASCPYKADDSVACNAAKWGQPASWKLIGGKSRAPSIEELEDNLIQHGALAVTVAACNDFAPDASGRITKCGCKQVNHMVQLVGYRTMQDGTTEFLIKNSWGRGWGAQGYAWSRQSCNKLASSRGNAALYVTY